MVTLTAGKAFGMVVPRVLQAVREIFLKNFFKEGPPCG